MKRSMILVSLRVVIQGLKSYLGCSGLNTVFSFQSTYWGVLEEITI